MKNIMNETRYWFYGLNILLIGHILMGSVMAQEQNNISLPEISIIDDQSLLQLLSQRRSVRDLEDTPLSMSQVAQLLWAAQGVTHPEGYRTAPSAGALYPLELYLAVGEVEDIAFGVYQYDARSHQLFKKVDGDPRKNLARSALKQYWIKDAAVIVVFAAIYERTTWKYGKRGIRYVHMEVGNAAQNLYLQAESLGLGTTAVGAFDDEEVAELLQLPTDTKPLLLMPVGRKIK